MEFFREGQVECLPLSGGGEQIAYPIRPRVGTGSAAEAVEMSEAMAYWTVNLCPSSRCHVVARAAFVRRV